MTCYKMFDIFTSVLAIAVCLLYLRDYRRASKGAKMARMCTCAKVRK